MKSKNREVRIAKHTELIKKWLDLNRNNIVINQQDNTIKINLVIPKDFWKDYKYEGKNYNSILPKDRSNRRFYIIQEDNYGLKSVTFILGNDEDSNNRGELPTLTLVLPDYTKLSEKEVVIKMTDKEFNKNKNYIKTVVGFEIIGIDKLKLELASNSNLEKSVDGFINMMKITPEIEKNKIDFSISKINIAIEKARNFTKLVYQAKFFNQQILDQLNVDYISLFGEFKNRIDELKSGKYDNVKCLDILKKIDFKKIPIFNIRAKRSLDIVKHFELNLHVLKAFGEDLENQLNMYQVLYQFNDLQFIRTAINELIYHPLTSYSKNANLLSKVVVDKFFVSKVEPSDEIKLMNAIKLEIGIDTIIRELGNVIVKLQNKISDRRINCKEKQKYHLENMTDPRFVLKYEKLAKTINFCIIQYKKQLDKEYFIKSMSETKKYQVIESN